MVTGGQIPGTAQLAATASTSATPESLLNTVSSPVSASTAGSSMSRSGQAGTGSRAATAALRTDSSTVSLFSASAPTARRASSGEVAGVTAAVNRASSSSMSSWTSISAEASLSCRSYRPASGPPLVIWAATADPADVPTTRSAASTRSASPGSASCSPRSTPSSQAMPATPPPASTSAFFISNILSPATRPRLAPMGVGVATMLSGWPARLGRRVRSVGGGREHRGDQVGDGGHAGRLGVVGGAVVEAELELVGPRVGRPGVMGGAGRAGRDEQGAGLRRHLLGALAPPAGHGPAPVRDLGREAPGGGAGVRWQHGQVLHEHQPAPGSTVLDLGRQLPQVLPQLGEPLLGQGRIGERGELAAEGRQGLDRAGQAGEQDT